MIAGIITTPDRQQFLPGVLKAVAPFAKETTIFTDLGWQGHRFNLTRCLRQMLNRPQASTPEPVLIASDDVAAPSFWFDAFRRINEEANARLYVLMNRQRHHFTDDNLRRGWTLGVHRRGFYDCAFVLVGWPTLLDEVLAWEPSATLPARAERHFDVVIQEYLVQNNLPWVITTPTLFTHVGGEASTMGHAIGGSPCYAGDPGVHAYVTGLRQ